MSCELWEFQAIQDEVPTVGLECRHLPFLDPPAALRKPATRLFSEE
jgi:hypothetical protein